MTQVQCRRCGTKVSAAEVRYVSPDTFYCASCFLGHAGTPRKSGASRTDAHYDASPVQKEVLVCAKCGYTNRFSPDVERKICGYCGTSDLRPKATTAAKLLSETDIDTEE